MTAAPVAQDTALAVADLSVSTTSGTPVLSGVSYSIAPGEVLALVGESGSGKTTAGLAALGHFRTGLVPTGGSVRASGRDGEPTEVLRLSDRERRALRGSTLAYIPQDPALSLNPGMRIGRQIAEVLEIHGFGFSAGERAARVRQALGEVGLPDDPAYQRRYPHQLSGGQQQRVGIAMAFACRPSVVVLDEPTTGLDVTTQALILQTVRHLAAEHSAAALYITHDLAVVAAIADRVAVMYQGSVVECGATEQVLRAPSHEYTAKLMAAVPDLAGARAPAMATPVTPPEAAAPLLAASELSVSYADNHVLDQVSVRLDRGESMLLLGESGSGKTTLARTLCGLVDEYTGTVELNGRPLARSTTERSAESLRAVQYVFQSPFSSLNPRKTIAQSLEVPLARLTDLDRAQRKARIAEVLEQVRFSESIAHRLPDQLSGGERQRAAIARALVTTPQVLVCDEVTSALDVSVQAAIVELLAELRRELDMAILFVTHNIALARHVADRIAVLCDGKIVETGSVDTVLDAPSHPYTTELLGNTPQL